MRAAPSSWQPNALGANSACSTSIEAHLGYLIVTSPISRSRARALQRYLVQTMEAAPILNPQEDLKYYRKRPPPERIHPGMIVYTHVSMAMFPAQSTRPAQLVETLVGFSEGDNRNTSSIPSFTGTATRQTGRSYGAGYKAYGKPRPCVILFVGKPEVETVIMAPITSWDGHHLDEPEGISEDAIRRLFFPIPDTPPHNIMDERQQPRLQDIIHVPNWKWRSHWKTKSVNRHPQYLVIGMPVSCEMKLLKGSAWECFHLDPKETRRCQRKSINFMAEEEIDYFQLHDIQLQDDTSQV